MIGKNMVRETQEVASQQMTKEEIERFVSNVWTSSEERKSFLNKLGERGITEEEIREQVKKYLAENPERRKSVEL